MVVGFGDHIVLDHLSILTSTVVKSSGSSVLPAAARRCSCDTILGLLPKRAGTIKVLGVDLPAAPDAERQTIERRWGVLFQQGALFSSLTVRENLQFPIREYLQAVAATAR